MDEQTQDAMIPEIGRRIIEARRELGMSQQELADLVHVSVRSMQAYESGEVVPYRKLSDLASVLDKSAAWILHGNKASDPVGETMALREIADKLDRIAVALESRGIPA